MPSQRDLIAAMSGEQKISLLYDRKKESFEKECREFGVGFVDGLTATSLINDVERGVSRREPLLGMMLASAYIYSNGTEAQARHELQTQTEDSQFGALLANEISDRAASIRHLVEECTKLESAYAAVILGRRELDIHYQSDEGDFIDTASTQQLELFD